ncbi:DNA (cytosine-5-)-methyltransferase [Mycoplasma sp. 2045]|uniref:DNA (cytosine-5-)-methyltransferase n=1 Tax=Mycoplasma sp. 2045 TaxID=2967301 RepID=UPI00211BCE69|nr:DNA (cytosine-5-)-methyltransferase [Mycoplasma sp. 2045]UUM20509.1 DNA (cytosine-5-)-methyltransferase [Mycoplasma sp. 2045]
MEFRILDIFCGAGGLSCGLDSVPNFKTLIGVDFDEKVLLTFKENIKGSETIHGDLTNRDVKDKIIKLAKKKKINMIVGGPPCQGFSLKGKNLGLDDPRNFLFKEYIEIVKELEPEIFIIENVKNLINAANGYFMKQILEEFHQLGYIINYDVLDALNFGIPQHRERAIIIGSKTKSILPPKGNNKIVTVREAISDLAYLNSAEGSFESAYKFSPQSDYQRSMRKNSNTLYNHQATNHSEVALNKLSLIPAEGDKKSLPQELHGKQKFSTTWSRLVWDSYSPTIDTRFDTPSNGRNSHPVLNRAITPREAARLQSFPDTYIFYGNKCNVCKQIGNAVPPLLAKAIAEEIAKVYEEKTVKTEKFECHLANSLTFVKELQANKVKVDAIITDPPYNISKENNFNTLNNPRKGVDFGAWDNNFDVCGWIENYAKLLKPNGSIIIFCSYLFISFLCDALDNNDINVKDILVWKKTNPMPRNVNRRYVQDMEFAIWGVKKHGKWTFNKPEKIPYLRSTFESAVVSGIERTIHPTQKSLKIMNEIIRIHTNPGDLILDPFMGSGTTGVAAIQNHRKFIGIEVNDDYFNLAIDRLLKTKETSSDDYSRNWTSIEKRISNKNTQSRQKVS